METSKEKQCQMCRKIKTIKSVCVTCGKRIICEDCEQVHSVFPALKSHEVLPMEVENNVDDVKRACKIHKEVVEYFCVYCDVEMCIVCLCDPVHTQHNPDKIISYNNGIQNVREHINRLEKALDADERQLNVCLKIVEKELKVFKKMKESMLDRMNKTLSMLTTSEADLVNLAQSLNDQYQQVTDLKTNLQNLSKLKGDEYVKSAKDWRKKFEQLQVNEYQKLTADEVYV